MQPIITLVSLSWLTSPEPVFIKPPYRKISWSLEAARLDVIMIVSLWNLIGISEALEKSQPKSRGFETKRDITIGRPSA